MNISATATGRAITFAGLFLFLSPSGPTLAATKDHIVPYHPRLILRGESGWDRNVVGSFAWRIMKDVPGPPRHPLLPQQDSLYWEFRYSHTGIDYGADFMFNSGDYYTYSAQVLNPILAAKAMELGWSRDIPETGEPFSSARYKPMHTADEYYADARTKLLWMMDRDQPIDAFYNVRFGTMAYDWLYNAKFSSGQSVLSVTDKDLLARRFIGNAEFIKTNYARPAEDELFRGTHFAHYLYVLVGFALYEPTRVGDASYAAINAKAEALLADYDNYWDGKILSALRAQGGGTWHGGVGQLNAELDYFHPDQDVLPWHLAPILFSINTALGRDTAEPPFGWLRDGVEFQAHMFLPSNNEVLGTYWSLGGSSPEINSRTAWVWPQFMYCRRRFSPQPQEQRVAELGSWLRLNKSISFVGGGSWDMIYHILWKDKFPNPRPPEEVGFKLVRHFRDLGWVSMRSGFSSSNDLSALFVAQKYRWSHLDLPFQNGFALHRRTELLTATNGSPLRIGGQGQREPSSYPKIDEGLSAYAPGSVWDVGPGVTAFADNPTFTYAQGDATHAYDTNQLEKFTRQVVFLKTNHLFVLFDRVTTKTSTIEKRWTLGTGAQPQSNATDLVSIHRGPDALWLKRLLPSNAVTTTLPSEISVVPRNPGREDYFLHLIEAVDEGTPRAALRVSAATLAPRGDWFDVNVAGTKLSFSRSGEFQFNDNQLPRAVVGTVTEAQVGQAVTFSANGSSDPDGQVVSYHWDFEDGMSASGAQATHVFAWPGTYAVTLTVTDDRGATGSTTVEVSVSASGQIAMRPRLELDRSATNTLLLIWPAAAAEFQLQESRTLTMPQWSPVSTAATTVGTNRTVVAPLPDGNRFYRLVRP